MQDLTPMPRLRRATFKTRHCCKSFCFGFAIDAREREAARFARLVEVRSVRTAPWRSRPSMGRDLLCIPLNSVASGRVGRGSDRRRLRHVLDIGGVACEGAGRGQAEFAAV